MDIAGPLVTSSEGFKYIFLVTESLSRWPEIFCLKTMTSEEIVECLYKVITRFGAFDTLVSDLGTQLTSRVTKALMRVFKIKRVHTSSFHPQSNAVAERYFREIWQYLRHYVEDDNQGQWTAFIDPLLYSLRGAVSVKTSGLSPYECLYGKPMRMVIDTEFLKETNLPKDVECYMKTLRPRVELTEKIVKENKMEAQMKNKEYYDRGSTEPTFNIGDMVYLKDMSRTVGRSKKLEKIFKGPLIIVQKGSKNSYRLRNVATDKPLSHPVNGNRLKLCNPPAEKFYSKVERAKRDWERLQEESRHRTRDRQENDENTGVEEDEREGQVQVRNDRPESSSAQGQEPQQGSPGETVEDQTMASQGMRSAGVEPTVDGKGVETTGNLNTTRPAGKLDGWLPIIELLKRKGKGSSMKYLVKWLDHSTSWIRAANISLPAKQAYYRKEAELGRVQRRRRKRSY